MLPRSPSVARSLSNSSSSAWSDLRRRSDFEAPGDDELRSGRFQRVGSALTPSGNSCWVAAAFRGVAAWRRLTTAVVGAPVLRPAQSAQPDMLQEWLQALAGLKAMGRFRNKPGDATRLMHEILEEAIAHNPQWTRITHLLTVARADLARLADEAPLTTAGLVTYDRVTRYDRFYPVSTLSPAPNALSPMSSS